MKASIKVCTAAKEFTEDQSHIIKRVSRVLADHGLSVCVTQKVKKIKVLRLKAV